MPRVPRTPTRRRRVGMASAPSWVAACETKATERSAAVAPCAPNCGPSTRGSQVSVAAFGSPVTPYAGKPDLSTSCGLAPKNSGRHSTMSASFPVSMEPISCARPWAMAGLTVSLAMYRSTRALSSPGPSPSIGPSSAFIFPAMAKVRRTVSPARPMPWASDEVIPMAPRSCSTSSAPIVPALIRSRAMAASPGRSVFRS